MVIAAVGEGWCFLIDGVSYFAVIASLMLMRIQPSNIRAQCDSMLEQMREGWDYVSTFRPIRTILLLFALLSLMGWPYAVLMPIFAAPGAARRRDHARLAHRRFRRWCVSASAMYLCARHQCSGWYQQGFASGR